jgi:Protein of Unknown function (DUF2784)
VPAFRGAPGRQRPGPDVLAPVSCPYTFDFPATCRALADGVLVLHFLFLAFVLLGALLVVRHPIVAWFHLPAVFWGAVIEFKGWICPLTPLENRLRELGGQAPYTTSFIERYVLPLVYPAHLTRELQIFFAVGVLVINAGLYGWLLMRRSSPNVRPSN